MKQKSKKKKYWTDYLWTYSAVYFVLGFFNIAFAWLGLLCFTIPLVLSLKTGQKTYCNKYCGRAQLFDIFATEYKWSRNKPMPKFLRTKAFRYGFLIFFLIMFVNMIFTTYLVFSGAQNLREVLTLFWTFKLPFSFVNTSNISGWVAQFAYGFYSMMLTSSIIGIILNTLYKPHSWCVACPMGTMTQGICQAKASLAKEKVLAE